MPCIDIVIPSYNSGKALEHTMVSVINQKLDSDWNKNIILVDDGSTDDSVNSLPENIINSITIIKNTSNKGRSVTRNVGASNGKGEYILFLDSDCVCAHKDSFKFLLDEHKNTYEVVCGSVQSNGLGFWSKYFNLVSAKREQLAKKGQFSAFTSQYFSITRKAFNASNGFNEEYRHYGFEDRDLALRLQRQGARFIYTSASIVFHDEINSLHSVIQKMEDAGKFSSLLFYKSFPSIYRSMVYGRLDSRLHPISIKLIVTVIYPFKNLIYQTGASILRFKYTPFSIKKNTIKIVSAIAYSIGTHKTR